MLMGHKLKEEASFIIEEVPSMRESKAGWYIAILIIACMAGFVHTFQGNLIHHISSCFIKSYSVSKAQKAPF